MTKRIIISLAMIALTIAGVTSATVAYFSDTAKVAGATISAGTLDLRVDRNPDSNVYDWVDNFTVPSKFLPKKIHPGQSGEQIFDIANVGTVDGNATIDLNRTSAWSDLAGILNFHVYYDGNHDGIFDETGLNGTIDQYQGPYTLGPISGTDVQGMKVASVKIVWSVPTSAGNEVQGDALTADVVFGLEQTR